MKVKVLKPELIERVAQKANFTKKDTAAFLNALEEVITESLRGGHEVSVAGGALYPKHRQARIGVRPGTSERIHFPASVGVGFRPGKDLKTAVGLLAP